MTTDEITTAIATLPDDATPDQFATVLNLLNYIRQFERDARGMLEERMIEQIEATGRDIVIGTVRKYLGHQRTTKGNDNTAIMTAMIVACRGDIEEVARNALCSDAFKPGFAKQVLAPDVFNRLFTTTEKTVIKDGKPAKQLLTADERFVKASSGNLPECSHE